MRTVSAPDDRVLTPPFHGLLVEENSAEQGTHQRLVVVNVLECLKLYGGKQSVVFGVRKKKR